MFEKVNPSHPDKIADRIAGALVDLAYQKTPNAKIAVEVLIGHGHCTIITESEVEFGYCEVFPIVQRLSNCENIELKLIQNKQDKKLNDNQSHGVKCGDNGIFKGVPIASDEKWLFRAAQLLYYVFPFDGKHIIDGDTITICQSNAKTEDIGAIFSSCTEDIIINPLGYWTGGLYVDTGATNRKLGSDMGEGVTGGGLHGKDLSKADVSVNIYAFIKAQITNRPVRLSCSIGDSTVDGTNYEDIVELAHKFIRHIGGFEKFAEWGLYCPSSLEFIKLLNNGEIEHNCEKLKQ